MAVYAKGLNDAETVKLWSRKLFREALKSTWMYRFMGRSSDSVIQILDDISKGPGDRIRVPLRMQLTGAGISGDNTLEGQEEALSTYTDDLVVDQLRHASRSGGRMSEQRVTFDVREECRLALTDWWADRIDTWCFNHLCGNTGQADTKYTGFNATVAPSTNNIVYQTVQDDVPNTSEASLDSIGEAFTVTLIDRALEKAKTNSPAIRPVKVDGDEYYVAFLHPYQVYDLRTTATANTVQWYDVQKAVLQGGGIRDNPIFSGSLGVYNGVILHESTRIPSVTANVRRAVLCGAQSGLIAFSKNNSPTRMTWVEELFDYGNQLGVAAGMIAGMKKTVFNSADFATVVMASYAAAH